MKALELKVPPVIVVGVIAAIMQLISHSLPTVKIPLTLRVSLTAIIVVLAMVSGVWGVWEFRKQRTTVNPHTPEKSSSLVTSGVFQFTRNPMYLGLAMLLVALAAYKSSPLLIAGVVVFILYMNRFQISPEERFMKQHFGQEYTEYCLRVRRWL